MPKALPPRSSGSEGGCGPDGAPRGARPPRGPVPLPEVDCSRHRSNEAHRGAPVMPVFCGPGWDQVPPPGPPKAGDATGSQWEAGPRARPFGARTGKLPGLPLRPPGSNPPVAPRASTSFCSARSRGWEVRGYQ